MSMKERRENRISDSPAVLSVRCRSVDVPVIPQLAERRQFGVHQDDQLAQQIIGAKGNLLEVRLHAAVAGVNAVVAKGVEARIAMKLGQQIGFRHVALPVVFEQPDITVAGLGQHLFEGQGQASAVRVAAESVTAVSIGYDLCHGAAPAGHVPYAAGFAFGQYRQSCSKMLGRLFQVTVGAVYDAKERIGALLAPEQHAVEFHPLGSPQSGTFHVVGRFDDGCAQCVEFSVAATVFKGREEERLGLQIDDFFDSGCHGVATIGNDAYGHSPPNVRYKDVLQIGHAGNTVGSAEVFEQLTVGRRKDDAALYGCSDHGAFGQMAGQRFGSWHEHVAMQHAAGFPGVEQGCLGVVLVPDDGQQPGVLHRKRVARIGRCGAGSPAAGAERQEGGQQQIDDGLHQRKKIIELEPIPPALNVLPR